MIISAEQGETYLLADDLKAKREFTDLIGKLGAAWGLPANACRVHALLYLNSTPTKITVISESLDLSSETVIEALGFLIDYELAWTKDDQSYEAHDDPWDAMLKGLDQRRNRDLPEMKASLSACLDRFQTASRNEALQVSKMIKLVDDLSAIHAQAFRFSPRVLRGVVGVSGRAARLFGGRDK